MNNSLNNIDVRYQAATGVPEWSPRGADTWRPLSSNETIYFQGNNLVISNSTGVHIYTTNRYDDLTEHSECLRGDSATGKYYAKKDGYYGLTNNSQSMGVYKWVHLNAGDEVPYNVTWEWGDNRWGSGVFFSPVDPQL